MSTTRRSFLGAIFAAAAAPAIIRVSSLMPIYVPPEPRILTLWGDGLHDDTAGIQALFRGEMVMFRGAPYSGNLPGGMHRIPSGRFAMGDMVYV